MLTKPEESSSGLFFEYIWNHSIFKALRKILYSIMLIFFCFGCSPKSELEKNIEGIDKVIDGIEVRCEVENRIIKDESESLEILRSNYDKANSDGMREKVAREIRLKEAVIEKSKNSRFNQDKILEELRIKKDSLVEILNREQ